MDFEKIWAVIRAKKPTPENYMSNSEVNLTEENFVFYINSLKQDFSGTITTRAFYKKEMEPTSISSIHLWSSLLSWVSADS